MKWLVNMNSHVGDYTTSRESSIQVGGFNPFEKCKSKWKSEPCRNEHKTNTWNHNLASHPPGTTRTTNACVGKKSSTISATQFLPKDTSSCWSLNSVQVPLKCWEKDQSPNANPSWPGSTAGSGGCGCGGCGGCGCGFACGCGGGCCCCLKMSY